MGGLADIFDSIAAQEERQITGLSKGQQGKPEDALPQLKKQAQEVDKAMDYATATMDYIRGHESFRDSIYLDSKGIPTVGYGFKVDDPLTKKYVPKDVLSGKRKMTKEEGISAFNNRFQDAMNDAVSFIGGKENFVKLSNAQKQGLIDMAYNLGLTSLNGFGELRKALFLGDKLAAKREVLDSKYAREDVPKRALQNANLMLK